MSCRGSELHCELEGIHRELHQVKTALNKARQAVTDREHQLALAAAAAEGQVKALAARKADAGAGAEASLKVSDWGSFDLMPYDLMPRSTTLVRQTARDVNLHQKPCCGLRAL